MIIDGCFMELTEMLAELMEGVEDGIVLNDDCEHLNPSDTKEFCSVCFITNLFDNVSMEEPGFSDETTERQREAIEELWERWINR